jgi:hypothetical protein
MKDDRPEPHALAEKERLIGLSRYPKLSVAIRIFFSMPAR